MITGAALSTKSCDRRRVGNASARLLPLNPLRAIVIALTLTSGIASAQPPTPGADASPDALNRLVLESASGSASTLADGVLHLREDGGSARTRRIASDFTMTAEIRLATPASELEVGLRTINVAGGWPDRGHRLRINTVAPPALVSTKASAKLLSTGTRVPAAGTWHLLRIMASGPRTHVWLDNEPAGVYEIDAKAGAVLLNAVRGDVEVRKLTFAYLPPKIVPATDYKGRTDFTFPKLRREVKPDYSANARSRKVEGVIIYEVVVETDSSVGAVMLKSVLDPELEHAGSKQSVSGGSRPRRSPARRSRSSSISR